MKWAKFVLALVLLPVCVGAAEALVRVLRAAGAADTVWAGILAGAACWLAIFILLPKPMRLYVYGHELTHVLWVWLMGGRVKRFKATSQGGHVVVTKSNFLVALAPYFFPFYALLVVAVYLLARWLWHWQELGSRAVWFHLLLGAAYMFHLTLTWHILQSRQTDITENGYLFSAVVIFLGNALVLLVAVPLLSQQVRLLDGFVWWWQDSLSLLSAISERWPGGN